MEQFLPTSFNIFRTRPNIVLSNTSFLNTDNVTTCGPESVLLKGTDIGRNNRKFGLPDKPRTFAWEAQRTVKKSKEPGWIGSENAKKIGALVTPGGNQTKAIIRPCAMAKCTAGQDKQRKESPQSPGTLQNP